MGKHFSILALRAPGTLQKGKKVSIHYISLAILLLIVICTLKWHQSYPHSPSPSNYYFTLFFSHLIFLDSTYN